MYVSLRLTLEGSLELEYARNSELGVYMQVVVS